MYEIIDSRTDNWGGRRDVSRDLTNLMFIRDSRGHGLTGSFTHNSDLGDIDYEFHMIEHKTNPMIGVYVISAIVFGWIILLSVQSMI